MQIFSPYYPCSSPLGDYSLTCRITPQKQVPLLILLRNFYKSNCVHSCSSLSLCLKQACLQVCVCPQGEVSIPGPMSLPQGGYGWSHVPSGNRPTWYQVPSGGYTRGIPKVGVGIPEGVGGYTRGRYTRGVQRGRYTS